MAADGVLPPRPEPLVVRAAGEFRDRLNKGLDDDPILRVKAPGARGRHVRRRGGRLRSLAGTSLLALIALAAGVLVSPTLVGWLHLQYPQGAARIEQTQALLLEGAGLPAPPVAVTAASPVGPATGAPSAEVERLSGEVAALRRQQEEAEDTLLAMLLRNDRLWQQLTEIDALRRRETTDLAASLRAGGAASATPEDAIIAMLARSDATWRNLSALDALRGGPPATAPDATGDGTAETAILAMLARNERLWRELDALAALRDRETTSLTASLRGVETGRVAPEEAILAMLARTDQIWQDLDGLDSLREDASKSLLEPGEAAGDTVLAMVARNERLWRDLAVLDALRASRAGQFAMTISGSPLPGAGPHPGLSEAEMTKLKELYQRTMALDRAVMEIQQGSASMPERVPAIGHDIPSVPVPAAVP